MNPKIRLLNLINASRIYRDFSTAVYFLFCLLTPQSVEIINVYFNADSLVANNKNLLFKVTESELTADHGQHLNSSIYQFAVTIFVYLQH